MSDDTQHEWMTAREVARLLKVTERMIGHYAAQGKLRTRREGRRVWYYSEDVQKLAGTLHADLRIAQTTREDVNRAMVDYIQDRQRVDREMLDRLQRIEERLDQPSPPAERGPSWQLVATLVLVLAIGLIVLAIVWRFVL